MAQKDSLIGFVGLMEPEQVKDIKHHTESLNQGNKARKRNNMHVDWKRSKTVSFIDNKILFVRNPRESM